MIRSYRLLCSLLLLLTGIVRAGASPGDSAEEAQVAQQAAMIAYLDSADKTMPYAHGSVKLREFATLNVPKGYKFLPEDQTRWLVEQVWGNPADASVMGMLVIDTYKISNTDAWAFIVSYDEDGFVKDDDAADINYDDLKKEIQESEAESNKQRVAAGFPAMHFEGWASKPYYDADNKVLHWAKDLRFAGNDYATLNYDVRILGRKGILSMNAVGTMNQLADIQAHIPDILHAAAFAEGYRYKDFDPKIDKVAAYTVGGLIAGKLLAKAGLLALILKNIKLVGLAIVGIIGAFRKRLAGLFNRRRDAPDQYAVSPVEAEDTTLPPGTEEKA